MKVGLLRFVKPGGDSLTAHQTLLGGNAWSALFARVCG
jgi:hypothetical protein